VKAKRVLRAVAIALAALVLAAAAAAATGAYLGLFEGKRPVGLGFDEDRGRFRAPGDWRPNWVSSTVPPGDEHYIAPYEIRGDRAKVWLALSAAIESAPGAVIVRRDPGYLQVEFHSKVMGFVDDAEFQIDPAGGKVIHVRAGARLGLRDFGVNRKRLEGFRAAASGG
jgi:uncharacterized protein (DUF1499 family)